MAERPPAATTSPTVGVAPLHLRRLSNAASLVAAVELALQRGVLAVLEEGPCSLALLGRRTGLAPSTCGVLVRQLQHAGIVGRDGTGGVELLADVDGVRWTLRRWDALPAIAAGDPGAPTADLYPTIVPLLAVRHDDAAQVVAQILGRDGMHLLDLGGGASAVGRHLARRHAGVTVTVVDRPDVLAALEGLLDDLAPAFHLVAADLLRDPLPDEADVTLLSGVLHLFDEADVVRLLRRAVRGTRDGGQVAIAEPLLREDGSVDADVTSYEIDLHLRYPQGGIWPYSRLAEWCARAGLRGMARHDLPGTMSLVTGEVDLRSSTSTSVT